MLSGNGRHRRPRQAPALLVAAGVTGSAIAIPLLGAASANAADGSTWDKVANCETGGSWSENSGNGFYGGLRLSQEDWEKYGGLDYAPSADLASRNQQIAVAEKLLAAEGVGAFHTCGLTSGLSQDDVSDDIDTGVGNNSSDSAGSSGSSDTSDGSGESGGSGLSDGLGLSGTSGSSDGSSDTSSSSGGSSDSSASPSPSASQDNSAKSDTSASPSPSQSADGSPTEPAGTDNPEQSVGSWHLVDTGSVGSGRHRGGSAEESATDADSASSSGRHASRTGDSYTVRAGDTLASIADSLDLQGGWRALYALNEKAIGADPSRIVPGQTLLVGS
ncbi:transglycosylase family protein [Streptomyces sp. 7R007]